MKKRIFSLILAVALLYSMIVIASAATVSVGRTYRNNFSYSTTDSCRVDDFFCVIEAYDTTYSISTNVQAHARKDDATDFVVTYVGQPAYLISSTTGNPPYPLWRIMCYYLMDGHMATSQEVVAS